MQALAGVAVDAQVLQRGDAASVEADVPAWHREDRVAANVPCFQSGRGELEPVGPGFSGAQV